MLCEKCGNEFEGNFCPKCGTAVQATASTFNVNNSQLNNAHNPTNINQKKQKKPFYKNKWFYIIVTVLVLSAIFGNNTNKNKSAKNYSNTSYTAGAVVSADSPDKYLVTNSCSLNFLGEYVYLPENSRTCIIGSTKKQVESILTHFTETESYIKTDPYSIKFANDNLCFCVDFNSEWVATGVYVESYNCPDPISGEGAYVYLNFDEIVSLCKGEEDIIVKKDVDYANLSQTKKYPMCIEIGEVHKDDWN